MRTLVIYKSKLHIYTNTSFSPSLFVPTRVLDIGCAIHSCVVVATQCMHGSASVPPPCAVSWPPSSRSIKARASAYSVIIGFASVWSIDITIIERCNASYFKLNASNGCGYATVIQKAKRTETHACSSAE